MKEIILIVAIMCLLIVLQTSFLPHFLLKGMVVNLVVVYSIGLSLVERRQPDQVLVGACIGGFLLDVFSQKPFGFWTTLLIATSMLIQQFMQKYVQNPFLKKA